MLRDCFAFFSELIRRSFVYTRADFAWNWIGGRNPQRTRWNWWGLVIVPLLVMLGGMSQISAQGTSIGALILPVGIFAAIKYYNAGNLEIRSSLYIALAMAAGAYLGATLALQLPQDTLKKIFGIVLVAAGLKFLLSK